MVSGDMNQSGVTHQVLIERLKNLMTKQTPHTVINYPKPALDLTNILIIGMDKLWDRSPHQHTYVLEYVNS